MAYHQLLGQLVDTDRRTNTVARGERRKTTGETRCGWATERCWARMNPAGKLEEGEPLRGRQFSVQQHWCVCKQQCVFLYTGAYGLSDLRSDESERWVGKYQLSLDAPCLQVPPQPAGQDESGRKTRGGRAFEGSSIQRSAALVCL